MSTSTMRKTIRVGDTEINEGETLCKYAYIHGGENEGLYAFVNEKQLAEGEHNKKLIKGMVIKREGKYVYIDKNGEHWPKKQPNQELLKAIYDSQPIKYTDGALTPEEIFDLENQEGGQRRNKKRTYKKRTHKKRTHKKRTYKKRTHKKRTHKKLRR